MTRRIITCLLEGSYLCLPLLLGGSQTQCILTTNKTQRRNCWSLVIVFHLHTVRGSMGLLCLPTPRKLNHSCNVAKYTIPMDPITTCCRYRAFGFPALKSTCQSIISKIALHLHGEVLRRFQSNRGKIRKFVGPKISLGKKRR